MVTDCNDLTVRTLCCGLVMVYYINLACKA